MLPEANDNDVSELASVHSQDEHDRLLHPMAEEMIRVPSPPLADMEEEFDGAHDVVNDADPTINEFDEDGLESRDLPDDLDGVYPNSLVPLSYGYGSGTVITDEHHQPVFIPDIVNSYQQKKNLAQGMMDLALISANANQLRYVLETFDRHPYNYLSLVLISCSLILQVVVGIGLIMNSRYNVTKEEDIVKADRINNYTIIGIFLVTIFNVFIASFGVADIRTDV